MKKLNKISTATFLGYFALASLNCAWADQTNASTAQSSQGGNSVIDKTGRAIGKGAKAMADGAEYVAGKVVKGVKRGANAAAYGVERGARATSDALETAAEKVGISGGSNGSGAGNSSNSGS